MTKTAFLFPGQGAQYVGMAREIIEADSEIVKHLNRFAERTGYDLKSIMMEGPEDKLKDTRFTQPAILFHSVAAWKIFNKEFAIEPAYVAGHSLGEFSALVASGVLDFDDALYLVHKRGEYMIKASEGSSYAMAAIIGLSPQKVVDICQTASTAGIVIAANFNTPVQTVISGSREGVKAAQDLAVEAGAKRVVPLVVGGAFHSPLVAKAERWLAEEMQSIRFNQTEIPVVSNMDALPATSPDVIKANLAKQVISSVRWVQSVEYMSSQRVELFVEFGPQKVLGGMLKKIDRNLRTANLEKPSDLVDLKELINSL